jgi:hypothetical protein
MYVMDMENFRAAPALYESQPVAFTWTQEATQTAALSKDGELSP